MITSTTLRSSLADRMRSALGGNRFGRGFWLAAAPVALLVLLGARVLWLATLNEDAFISYRCLENLMHGLGMTWLPDLRSQPYTHPLWMLLHIPLRFVIADVKVVGFLVSFACLAGVLWCLHRTYATWNPGYALVVLTPLLLSKCFTEYSTSGLENPLSHLLAVYFFTGFLGDRGKRFDMDQAAFLAAAAFLNRQDHALLYAIPLAVMWFERRNYLDDTRSLLVAALPVVAWFTFAVFYYGSALPDTYYAKLSAGIDKDLLIVQGLTTIVQFLEMDFSSFVAIMAGLVLAAVVTATTSVARQTRLRFAATASSIILFLAYVMYAGGDYMIGRFFTTPLVIAVVLAAESAIVLTDRQGSRADTVVTAPRLELGLCLAFGAAFLVSWSMPDFALGRQSKPSVHKFGGTDMHKHPWNVRLTNWALPADLVAAGEKSVRNSLAVPAAEHFVEWNGSAGIYGFSCGPSYGMLDAYGLVDPLLCRLPAQSYAAGHYARKLPAGYEKARRTGDTSEMNPHLAKYYESLRAVKGGDLLSPRRIAAAFAFAAGTDAHLTDDYVADMARDPTHKQDFWKTGRDRQAHMADIAKHKEFRGPIVSWYAKLVSETQTTKSP